MSTLGPCAGVDVKRCSKCRTMKDLEEFGPDKRANDGRQSACRGCMNQWHAEQYADDPQPKLEQARSWYEANPERGRSRSRRWSEANPERARELMRRAGLKRFGITIADFEGLLAFQGGHCALCLATSHHPKARHLGVDHDHTTGEVRGLLCVNCNGEVERVASGTRQGAPDVVGYLTDPPYRLWKRSQ